MAKKTTATATTTYLQTTGFTYDIALKKYKDFDGGEIIDKELAILTLAIGFIAEDGERKTYYRQHAILDTDCIRDLSLDLTNLQDRMTDEFNKWNGYNIKKLLDKYINDTLISEKR